MEKKVKVAEQCLFLLDAYTDHRHEDNFSQTPVEYSV